MTNIIRSLKHMRSSMKGILIITSILLLLVVTKVVLSVACYEGGLWLPIFNTPPDTRPMFGWQANLVANAITKSANCSCPEYEGSTGVNWYFNCVRSRADGFEDEYKIYLFTDEAVKNGEPKRISKVTWVMSQEKITISTRKILLASIPMKTAVYTIMILVN